MVRKLLEGILTDNGLIRGSQHGFVHGRSSPMNLKSQEFQEFETPIKFLKKVDGGSAIDIVYMGFSKDFDKISLDRLQWKVRSFT